MAELIQKLDADPSIQIPEGVSHLIRLFQNTDSLLKDAEILIKNNGSKKRILFLYLTAFEQLALAQAYLENTKIPFGHREKLAVFDNFMQQLAIEFKLDNTSISQVRNSCLYEDKNTNSSDIVLLLITASDQLFPRLKSYLLAQTSYLENAIDNSMKVFEKFNYDINEYTAFYENFLKSKKIDT